MAKRKNFQQNNVRSNIPVRDVREIDETIVPQYPEEPPKVKVFNCTVVNVRESPSKDGKVKSTAQKETLLDLLVRGPVWSKVENYDLDISGYVMNEYLEEVVE